MSPMHGCPSVTEAVAATHAAKKPQKVSGRYAAHVQCPRSEAAVLRRECDMPAGLQPYQKHASRSASARTSWDKAGLAICWHAQITKAPQIGYGVDCQIGRAPTDVHQSCECALSHKRKACELLHVLRMRCLWPRRHRAMLSAGATALCKLRAADAVLMCLTSG